MMRVFVYCRVSTEEQSTDNHYSLGNQEQRAKEYTKHKEGWRIVQTRKDVVSGKNDQRPGYQDLLSAIRTHSIDVVLVYRLDRLSRNVKDIYDFLDMIRDAGIGFVSLTEGFDTTTAMGRAMLGVAAVFAQLTREMIAENVKDGLLRRAQSGLYTGNPEGPYGYRYSKEDNTLVLVPTEAEIVRQIFSLYADRKWGVSKIASFINKSGIPTRGGGQWYEGNLRTLLHNPVYIGKVKSNNEVFDGKHEPILSREQWEQAQELIESRNAVPPRTQQSQHLLAGIAKCAGCGLGLNIHYTTKKNGPEYRSYRHTVKGQVGACPGVYKSADLIETAVVHQIRKLTESDQLQSVSYAEVEKQCIDEHAHFKSERDGIVAELEGISDRFTTWADRLDRGLIDEEQFMRQNERLLASKKTLTTRQAEIDKQLAKSTSDTISLETVRASLAEFPQVWDKLEIEERRELLRQLIERLEIGKDQMKLKLVLLPEVVVDISSRRAALS